MIELNERVDYYREKYDGMKELLTSCKEQLREFEELNLMRNEVIEKLEVENVTMKQAYSGSHVTPGYLGSPSSSMNSYRSP